MSAQIVLCNVCNSAPAAVMITTLADGNCMSPCEACLPALLVGWTGSLIDADPDAVASLAGSAGAPTEAPEPAPGRPTRSRTAKAKLSGPSSPELSAEEEAPGSGPSESDGPQRCNHGYSVDETCPECRNDEGDAAATSDS